MRPDLRGTAFAPLLLLTSLAANACNCDGGGTPSGAPGPQGCIEGSACDDGDPCTEGETCRAGRCEGGAPVDCDDRLFCNGRETCVAGEGCVHLEPPRCADAFDCTDDACDEEADRCSFAPVHARCGAGEWCNPFVGCEAAGGCLEDAECDDGKPCNGVARCDGGFCRPGDPPVCDDGASCTEDDCHDEAGGCVHAPVDAHCDDAVHCNGAGRCAPGAVGADAATGCVAEPVECPSDACRENARCDEATRACVWDVHDGDSDGAGSAACGGTDCDDANADVHPDAAETCNYRDDDCDGAVDEGFDHSVLSSHFYEVQDIRLGGGPGGFATVYPNALGTALDIFSTTGEVEGKRHSVTLEGGSAHAAMPLPSGRWAVLFNASTGRIRWVSYDPVTQTASAVSTLVTLAANARFTRPAVAGDRAALAFRVDGKPPEVALADMGGNLVNHLKLADGVSGALPGVALSPEGMLIAYESAEGITARAYDRDGSPFGTPLVLGVGGAPAVAWDGEAWVVIHHRGADLIGRRFAHGAGAPGTEITVVEGEDELRQVELLAAHQNLALLWKSASGATWTRIDRRLQPSGNRIQPTTNPSFKDVIFGFAASDGRTGILTFNSCVDCAPDPWGGWLNIIGCGGT